MPRYRRPSLRSTLPTSPPLFPEVQADVRAASLLQNRIAPSDLFGRSLYVYYTDLPCPRRADSRATQIARSAARSLSCIRASNLRISRQSRPQGSREDDGALSRHRVSDSECVTRYTSGAIIERWRVEHAAMCKVQCTVNRLPGNKCHYAVTVISPIAASRLGARLDASGFVFDET